MQESDEPLEDLIAGRLLAKAEQETKTQPNSPVGERKDPSTAVATADTKALQVDFVKIEKNLASLGFFTPSSKRIKGEKSKVISFTRMLDGKKVEGSATIAPTAIYGLPITADQDKYFALQKIVTDLHKQQGIVSNPIGFTSAELLRLLHKYRDSGKNYKDVEEWLDVMSSTTIISEGAVYFAGRRLWAKDRFHVFDRAVSFGKELEPGKIADKNYVWLSEWQLENINSKHQLPIDLETYRQLKTHIAKALVPLLQIWLYASRDQGSFEKRYDELCQILNTHQYQYYSKIKEKLGPALEELKTHGYLNRWEIEETTDHKGYKIIFQHGEKFYRDRQRRLAQKGTATEEIAKKPESRGEGPVEDPTTAASEHDPAEQGSEPRLQLAQQLSQRGLVGASEILAGLSLQQLDRAPDIIDYWDRIPGDKGPGLLRNLLTGNDDLPANFESRRRHQMRQEAQQARIAESQRLEQAYKEFCEELLTRAIDEKYTPEELQELLAGEEQTTRSEHPDWRETANFAAYAYSKLRERLKQELEVRFPTLAQFIEQGAPAGESNLLHRQEPPRPEAAP